MPDRLVDKPCPPGQHRHGGHNYCHDEARKHHTHAGEAVHGLRSPSESYSKPRAARNPLKGFSLPEVESMVSWVGPQPVARRINELVDKHREHLPLTVRHALGNAATEFMARNEEGGMGWLRRAHERMKHPEAWERKMKKAADKKRPDAEPVVAYEEAPIVITDVGTRLKAIAQKLDRMIKRGVVEDLDSVEKRAEKITKRRCC